jgi:Tfp pilus assembly protein PilF
MKKVRDRVEGAIGSRRAGRAAPRLMSNGRRALTEDRVNRRRRIAGAVALSLAAAAPGCAGPSPWSSLAGKPELPAPISVTAHAGDPSIEKLSQLDHSSNARFAEPSVQTIAAKKPAGGAVGGAIASAFQKTKAALTIEPKVVKAPDPLSLSTPTGDVGTELQFASARMHESQGNIERADALYRKAIEGSPRDLNLLVHYARMHDRAGSPDRAAEIYRQALQAHPGEASIYNDLGLCLARQKKLGDAMGTLRRATELQPTNALYRNNLATVLVDAGRPDEALSHLIAVHRPAAAHYNLGCLLYKAGRIDAAAGHLQQALAVDPQMSPAAELLASMSGRRDVETASAGEPIRGGFVSPTLHRTPPVAKEARASGDWTSQAPFRAGAGDWGPAPTPSQVLPSSGGGGILMPPSRAPFPDEDDSAPQAPMPQLLPPTRS